MKISIVDAKEKGRIRQAKWRSANLERVRKQARDHVTRKREADPEAYRIKSNEIAKKSREKHLEERKVKERENSRRLRAKDKDAYNLSQREYRRNNKEKFDGYFQKFKEKNKVGARIRLLKKYNLTHELYEKMLLKQEGKCAICKMLFEETKPNIDHDHDTGAVRGLLCSPCNIVLGYIEKIQKNIKDFDFVKFTEYLEIQSKQL